MQCFIFGYELVGKTEPWHESSLFEPENGAERTREEDALNSCKGDKSLVEGAAFVHPLKGPLCLFPDHIDVTDGLEQVLLLGRILYVGVDKERVGFRVDVLHRNLETVETPRLWHLHLGTELLV